MAGAKEMYSKVIAEYQRMSPTDKKRNYRRIQELWNRFT